MKEWSGKRRENQEAKPGGEVPSDWNGHETGRKVSGFYDLWRFWASPVHTNKDDGINVYKDTLAV